MSAPSPAGEARALPPLLRDVSGALDHLAFPLALPASAAARTSTEAARAQLADYILPRLASLDAPLVAVVGGSTGAGKSTLVNALVGRPVSATGAVRPTTRRPLLLHHPDDAGWFDDDRVLPSLARVRLGGDDGTAGEASASPGGPSHHPATGQGADTLLLRPTPTLPAGLALLDAPDVDSIADENRRLAGQLLAAADLWLFVTTANRYADAVPWKLLAEAGRRDVLVAIVLDRVPPGVEEEIRSDLLTLLSAENLGHAPIFVIPELPLGPARMLPADAVEPITRWLQALATDAEGRRDIARRTVQGAMRALAERVDGIAEAVSEEQAAGDELRAAADGAYREALRAVLAATEDGRLLRGEVLARWQDFVGTGEFMRGLESRIGRARDRVSAFFTGRPAPAATVAEAIGSGLQTVVVEQAARADESTRRRWRSDAAGRVLLEGIAPWHADAVSAEVAREIRAWQEDLLRLVQAEGADKRFTARMLSFGVNGIAVALMVVVFASTGGITGGELGIAGASAIAGQKLLEAVFGDDAVRRLTATAREDLSARVEGLFRQEREPFDRSLEPLARQTPAETLRVLARRLRTALPPGQRAAAGDGA
ncbi:dynamin family protein [Arthrobacter agilis]|uniref:dynamin family protein n=1 Tax=Arthrobacter agilis TaxID=37921 RepID=UPI002788975B|nr:dynamin family protein [Arthrobacter agilis]MDQ0735266.1 energy-coupling factor transporter ATP-binding protein EcfA2 [Arthrobacter agilis]